MQNETSLQELNTQSQTVNNAIITLGDTDDSGKGRHFKSRFIQPGVAGYPGQFGNVLITKQTLDKFIQSMVGVPVIIQHKNITAKNADDERVGVVNSVWYDENDGWYWCDGIIWDDTAINLIQDQGWSVSCSYDVKLADNAGGSENNIKYDMEFLDGVFTHLALVNNPRYERATIVFNSKTFNLDNAKEEDGRWITVKGTHLFIKDGQTVTEAMKEHGMAVDRKYSKENIDFDEKQLQKDIQKAKEAGLEDPSDIADYLGLDEDEVLATIKSPKPNLKELETQLEYYRTLIQKGDDSYFTKFFADSLKRRTQEARENRLKDSIQRAKDLAAITPKDKNKANNNLSFKERFIDTFYQALAEVLLEKTEKEL